MLNKKAFTLIELLIIIAIIGILASAILIGISQSRKNARINGAKTSMKSVLTAIIACKDGSGAVANPIAGNDICNPVSAGLANAKWPVLLYGYTYVAGGIYNSTSCSFEISTNNDTASNLSCGCISQSCK
ncbi:MAG: prepilin-type N-terminal cleavage/methylation domain-containing protein [bacterium]|nr:prepilin-type N-terminal cleavage/methylation domain-containing protein [bacterium]